MKYRRIDQYRYAQLQELYPGKIHERNVRYREHTSGTPFVEATPKSVEKEGYKRIVITGREFDSRDVRAYHHRIIFGVLIVILFALLFALFFLRPERT